jgi:hypothetical protein
MKKLYEFTLNKEIEKEVPELSKDNDGNEIKILKKIKQNEIHRYFIAKPNRSQMEAAEIFFASVVSRCVSQGILTVSLTQKMLLNEGGVLSNEQKNTYESLYNILFEKQAAHRNLLAKIEQTEEDKVNITNAFNEMVEVLTKIQDLENKTGNNLYQNTAETIARNRCSVFWTLNLSYKEENGKEVPVFPGKTYEEKLSSYDKLEEDGDEYYIKLINKLFLVTSLWYLGKAESQEEFEVLIKMHENQGIIGAISNIPEQNTDNKQQELKLENK